MPRQNSRPLTPKPGSMACTTRAANTRCPRKGPNACADLSALDLQSSSRELDRIPASVPQRIQLHHRLDALRCDLIRDTSLLTLDGESLSFGMGESVQRTLATGSGADGASGTLLTVYFTQSGFCCGPYLRCFCVETFSIKQSCISHLHQQVPQILRAKRST